MNNKNRLWRIAVFACMAALMAGAAACAMFAALQMPFRAAGVYLSALAAAALCGMAAFSRMLAIPAVGGGLILAGGAAMLHSDGVAQLAGVWRTLTDPAGRPMAEWTEAGALLGVWIPMALGVALFVLVSRRGGTAFALLVELAILIASYALSPSISLMWAVPGLVAAMAAFALSGELGGGQIWRALIPAVVAVIAALPLVPQNGTVWEPLENAANYVRAVFEDYFRFTQERVPFTISAEGYDHAAEVDGNVVTQLGGPATPDPEAVMRVTASGDVLLRGSIRRDYTGHAWVDSAAKARYLYYDFTRRGIRGDVFDMDGNEAFVPVSVAVEFLSEGTSTVFVPGRLEEFSMSRDAAVYYNSIGEMFLSRNVQAGDAYSLVGYRTSGAETLRSAAAAAQEKADARYGDMLESCTQLPEGIEDGVYALTMELTQSAASPVDKALAIQNWLRGNCTYALDVDYPDADRDFVSQFVLDSRRGYCSYFASAMTVMCRIAGLPARYVEGYSIHSDGGTVTVTGEDAHAWTEVYFSGLGWVPFDASNGADGGNDGLSNETGDGAPDNGIEAPEADDPEATMPPTEDATLPPDDGMSQPMPTPQATLPPEGDSDLEPTPSPTPDAGDWGNADEPTPEPSGMPNLPDAPQNPPQTPETPEPDARRNLTWLWILLGALLALLVAALIALWMRRRLAAADPLRLSEQADAQLATMILYRSILTLLRHTGQAPLSGETPTAFAERVCAQTENPDFEAFASAVERCAYTKDGADAEAVELGRRAYEAFMKQLRRGERWRFAWTRMTRGLGRFDAIP